jgi:polysaccharide export outer membrane protein
MIPKRFDRFLLIVSLLSFFYSCSPPALKPLFRSADDRISDTLQTVRQVNGNPDLYAAYRIQPEDRLSIRNATYKLIAEGGNESAGGSISGRSSSSAGFRVEADGFVSLPVIGRVNVLGLTRKEATDKIAQLYKDSLLTDQSVIEVSVLDPRVTILGEVANQGTYYLDRENVSAVEILGMAGGLTQHGDPRSMKIVRGNKANPQVIYVNLQNMQSLASQNVTVQNKDIIYIGPDKRFREYEKKQSSFSVFQSLLLLVSTGLVIYTTVFK